jgi:glycyl-tRNA synthetase beta chain
VSDFLLELASEEIPARMQAAAAEQLATRFADGLKAAGLAHGAIIADATPRRLWLIARDVATASAAASEERKGPAATAPEQAIAGFLRSTGLTRDQLEERQTPKGVVLFAHIKNEGRTAAAILAELVPAIVASFAWPKSMRWGEASVTTASPRWVRPLTGIIALLDGDVVACAAHGITAARMTRGHRIHAPEAISIATPDSYVAQLRDAKVIASSAERRDLILERAQTAAAAKGLTIIPDAGLVAENAGLTEWPVPLLGAFDPAFLAVPREVIQLTMRTNQKYFACADSAGALAPAFICVANLEASDGGIAVVAGNERVLSARLSDAKFFWDQDVATVKAGGLEAFLPKLSDIVFHEKLGTVADKVERVAKLARWLVESGAVPGDADLAERAAKLCKADLVSATVGEFPEVQGLAGAYLARIAGEDDAVADAMRDHYKPVGQGDDVPTAPVSVAVALADKLDTLIDFIAVDERPTGSRDPYAVRRAALGAIGIIVHNNVRVKLGSVFDLIYNEIKLMLDRTLFGYQIEFFPELTFSHTRYASLQFSELENFWYFECAEGSEGFQVPCSRAEAESYAKVMLLAPRAASETTLDFIADRLSVQQRDAKVRHDLIDAVFAIGNEDDLVRLLARVRALQSVLDTDDGVNLLAGVKRAANILRIEETKANTSIVAITDPALFSELAENGLAGALDRAVPVIERAVAMEDFATAMAVLAGLRSPIDAFFDTVIVNAPDPAVRLNRLGLLARLRVAANSVADFSKIEG